MSELPSRPTYSYTEDDWVQLRAHFMGSILADIHLHKLAQNIGASWPVKDKEETPSRYLEYSFAELADAPGLNGQPARLQLLLDILKETASFDDPFQDMVETTPNPAKSASNTVQMLQKLSIRSDYPVEFSGLSAESRSLCQEEGAPTIGEAVALFQGMAQSLIVGGEVRQFLNGLAHGDLHALAPFLPVRAGTRGFHLPEAIGLLFRSLPDSARNACIEDARRAPGGGTPASPIAVTTYDQLNARLPKLLEWFPEEAQVLRDRATSGGALDRFFITIGEADIEAAAAHLVRLHFRPAPVVEAAAPAPAAAPRQGFMSRLGGLFRSRS